MSQRASRVDPILNNVLNKDGFLLILRGRPLGHRARSSKRCIHSEGSRGPNGCHRSAAMPVVDVVSLLGLVGCALHRTPRTLSRWGTARQRGRVALLPLCFLGLARSAFLMVQGFRAEMVLRDPGESTRVESRAANTKRAYHKSIRRSILGRRSEELGVNLTMVDGHMT